MGMHGKKLYGTATVGSKGQVVIPAEAREAMGIQTGEKLYVFGSDHFIGMLKEDQFKEMLDRLTEHADAVRDIKEKLEQE
jgi:AbrB family looped-hinge helix DNA binding protein